MTARPLVTGRASVTGRALMPARALMTARAFLSRQGDRGAASVYALAVGLALVLAGSAIAMEGGRLVDREQARTAADLGALAGAQHAIEGQSAACAQAGRLVGRNGAVLLTCELAGLDVIVTAAVTRPGRDPARATARAGPLTDTG